MYFYTLISLCVDIFYKICSFSYTFTYNIRNENKEIALKVRFLNSFTLLQMADFPLEKPLQTSN